MTALKRAGKSKKQTNPKVRKRLRVDLRFSESLSASCLHLELEYTRGLKLLERSPSHLVLFLHSKDA